MAIRCRFNHSVNLFRPVKLPRLYRSYATTLEATSTLYTLHRTQSHRGNFWFLKTKRSICDFSQSEVSIATCTSSPNMQIQMSIRDIKLAKNNEISKISICEKLFFYWNKQLLSSSRALYYIFSYFY